MTGRVQSLRSSVAGNRPTGRQPGELYVNWPDAQLGVINALSAAQDLIAVRFFSALTSYNIGDYVVQAGKLYTANVAVSPGAFNPVAWTALPSLTDLGGPYLALAGGTLTGPLILAADPTAALGAATKEYADKMLPLAGGTLTGAVALAGVSTAPTAAPGTNTTQVATTAFVAAATSTSGVVNPNRIDNGDMYVDQHNLGAAVALANNTVVWCPDRFGNYQTAAAATSRFSVGQNLAAITSKAPGFPYFLGIRSTSAYSAAVGAQLYTDRKSVV